MILSINNKVIFYSSISEFNSPYSIVILFKFNYFIYSLIVPNMNWTRHNRHLTLKLRVKKTRLNFVNELQV
jgi:hypothetical protein